MTFSDDYLERLKNKLNKPSYGCVDMCWSRNEIKALLARLEAAEACAKELEKLLDFIYEEDKEICYPIIQAWRKTVDRE